MKAVADQRCKRLQYLCWHRGTQKIDLIFGNFADRSLSGFSIAQLDRFEALLDCTDADPFDWVTGQATPPPEHDHDVMRMLRVFHCHQNKR
jgi:antitoxin CptB